jgi:phosphoenolpyruvate-protein kinase (PTS system EI component)
MRSKMLEDELATAKGEILRLRRQISASGSQNAKGILDTSAATNANQSLRGQHVNDLVQDTINADAGASRSSKRVYRRRKNGPAT